MNLTWRRRLGLGGLGLWLLLVAAGGLGARGFRRQDRAAVLAAPSAEHWLGTDGFGRDQGARLLLATALSSLLGLAMAAPALGLALVAGGGAALWPALAPWTRAAGEICRSLPWIFVLVAVRAALPLDAGAGTIACALVVLFAAAAWPVAAWTFEGATRNLLQREFIEAARGCGATGAQILRRHVWPNLRGLVATYFALLVAAAIGAEVSLELVGLGLPQPWPTWGNLLDGLRDYTVATRCWWLYAPLLVLLPVLLGLNLAGEQSGAA